MKFQPTSLILSLLIITLSWACQKDDNPQGDNFDRRAMLENYAVNIIRPAYQHLLDETKELQNSWDLFINDANETNLLAVRAQWLETALAWQSANAFNFGPAGEEGLRRGLIEEIGTFPVDADKVEGFITAGDFTLNNFDRDSRGILAIEYLLYGKTDTAQDVVLALQDTDRREYLTAILRHLSVEVETVVDAWTAYQAEFIANDGTDAGSATSQLYNEFVRSYEAAKNFKVGVPAGKRAGQTQAEPQLVEGFYSGQSLDLLKAHLESIMRIYMGMPLTGSDGIGFHEYLQDVEGGGGLLANTFSQWQAVTTALGKVPTETALSELIEQDDPSVTELHTEMQKQIRFFKSDMSSLLGIAITFNSGDGD